MILELRALAELILAEVENIELAYRSADKPFPSLNVPNAEPLIEDPNVVRSASNIIAASSRLAASLENPHGALHRLSGAMYTSSFLNVVVEANITEVLKEAGSQGMHIRDLAKKVQIEPIKLGQAIRHLAALHHVYKEVAPDVFANNRLSIALDTGRPFDDIKDRGLTRYDFSEGSAAFVAYLTEVGVKGALKIAEVVVDPESTFSQDPDDSPMSRGLNAKIPYWEWLERPENKKSLNQLSAAMRNVGQLFPPSSVNSAFDWGSLPSGSLVVDVGGGIGGTTLTLVEKHPHLRFIVQDRPAVASDGEKHWQGVRPEALKTGLVEFEGHSFFDPQPVRDVAVFLLRFILHDWPNAHSKKILSSLRASATPQTRLVVLEFILPYTCPDNGEYETILGSTRVHLPKALHGNIGPARGTAFAADAEMLNWFNSQERTIGQWLELLNSAGWGIEEVREAELSSIICKPI